jgi:hypothetical protein
MGSCGRVGASGYPLFGGKTEYRCTDSTGRRDEMTK